MIRVALLTAALLALLAAPARAARTVGLGGDQRLHVFLVGPDGQLYQSVSPARGSWTPFSSLGGSLAPGPVAVGTNADGRLQVFARGGDNAVWTISEITPGGAWSAWSSLGGAITGSPDVARNTDGRLEVFARGPGSALWHTWQNAPGGSWSQWSSLGSVISSDPAARPYDTGALVVWARGAANQAQHIWQAGSGWSAWADDGGGFAGAIAPGLNADGRQEVFGRGPDGALYHRYQLHPDADWSDWGALAGAALSGDPAVAIDARNALNVFARGTDNALWHIWEDGSRPGGWSAWSSPGGQFAGDPVVGKDFGGALQVFAIGTDGVLYTSYQNGVAATDFSALAPIGRPVPSSPPPLASAPAPIVVAPKTIVVTLGFTYTARRRSTRLRSLSVKGVPRGATVSVTCRRGCSKRSYVKRNVRSGTVSLTLLVRRPLKVGTTITITVSAPNAIAAVKTLKIRSRHAPSVTTRCLAPGAKKVSRC